MSNSVRLCQIVSDCFFRRDTRSSSMYIIVRYTQLKHVSDHCRYLLTKKYLFPSTNTLSSLFPLQSSVFLEGIEDHIQGLLALGISTDEKKWKRKILHLGVWKAPGLRKDGFGRYLAMKGKKDKKFSYCKDWP